MANNRNIVWGLLIIPMLLSHIFCADFNIRASTADLSPEKQEKIYELRRERAASLEKVNSYISDMETNLSGMKERVNSVLKQMLSALDSNLNRSKNFKVTVDNLFI